MCSKCVNFNVLLKLMIKKYKTEQKQKEKEEAKSLKLKAKEDAKIANELEKQKLKEEKQKAKMNKKNPDENVILASSNVSLESIEGCVAILKSGPNKGKHCGCKTTDENLCGRHFKLVHNIIINN